MSVALLKNQFPPGTGLANEVVDECDQREYLNVSESTERTARTGAFCREDNAQACSQGPQRQCEENDNQSSLSPLPTAATLPPASLPEAVGRFGDLGETSHHGCYLMYNVINCHPRKNCGCQNRCRVRHRLRPSRLPPSSPASLHNLSPPCVCCSSVQNATMSCFLGSAHFDHHVSNACGDTEGVLALPRVVVLAHRFPLGRSPNLTRCPRFSVLGGL